MAEPGSEPDDILAALPALLPAIRQKTVEGWALIALVVGAVAAGIVLLGTLGGKLLQLQFIVVVVAVVVILGIVRRTQRAHEALIMPKLAETAGLRFAADASGFMQSLPLRLLPKAGKKTAEDLVWGDLGGRTIRFAEMNYETGGKNSKSLFKGIVISFPNLALMPAFFLAVEKETVPGFLSASHIAVNDLVRVGSTLQAGVAYGIWASSVEAGKNPMLDAVVKELTNLQNAVGSDAQLYSATSNGAIMHIAFTHKRDLFRIGGLTADEASLIGHIRQSYIDLTMPLTIAAKLLEAEQTVAAA